MPTNHQLSLQMLINPNELTIVYCQGNKQVLLWSNSNLDETTKPFCAWTPVITCHKKKHELFLDKIIQNVLYTNSKCIIDSGSLLETWNLHTTNSQKLK